MVVAFVVGVVGLNEVLSPLLFALAETSILSIVPYRKIRGCRHALPYLRKSQTPRIVGIASTEALAATKYDSAYCAAKAGLLGFTRALAVELAADGITVNAICPGPIDTAMTANIPEEDKRKYLHRRVPLNRYGKPEDIAGMALNLCLPSSSFITGATHLVDGGLMARSA